jgi:hypothetical protein
MIRVGAAARPPLGVIFGAIGVSAAAVVSILGLDRLPLSLCAWKTVMGIPCPTCGTTRALACLAHLDLAGAFAMNPLASSGALLIGAWAASDLALLPFRRALVVEMSAVPANVLRAVAVTALVANWIYLVAAGR